MDRFTLRQAAWYAWEMYPGYLDEIVLPYSLPIYFTNVDPLKTGQSYLRIKFLNVGYAKGVQDFELKLKILKRANNYLVSELMYDTEHPLDRCAIVGTIDFKWIEERCSALYQRYPPERYRADAREDVQEYLNNVFKVASIACS